MVKKWFKKLRRSENSALNEFTELQRSFNDRIEGSNSELVKRLDKISSELESLSRSADTLKARSGTKPKELAL